MPATRPLCVVFLPRAHAPEPGGRLVDVDRLYEDVVAPAAAEAGLDAKRIDEDTTEGQLSPLTFEGLILGDYAIVDLTTASADTFYAVGIRRALRASGTVMLVQESAGQLPFNLSRLNALTYTVTAEGGAADVRGLRAALIGRLTEPRPRRAESSVIELAGSSPDIDRLKTDVFRERVSYSQTVKRELAAAREQGGDAVRAVEARLGEIARLESAIVIDLFLSYRAVKAWDNMIALVDRMSPPLAATAMVREQLGLALNRAGRSEDAEVVLKTLIAERGPSSETCALLGRVYKDRWDSATKTGSRQAARVVLDHAIAAYLEGFESDWRDAYPGINAVTLMELRDPPDARRERLIPVVRYAVERRIASGHPDYWDHATLLELAVLAKHEQDAAAALERALASVREAWEPETTARNLALIREAREHRGERVPWAGDVEGALDRRSKP